MKLHEIHTLPTADKALFDKMATQYLSDKEKRFFENLIRLEQWDCSVAHDILLSQSDNEEHIFIVRVNCNEYIFGCDDLHGHRVCEHVMTLSAALSANLKTLGILDSDVTLFEWLRANDYAGVSFEHNLDYE